MKDKLFAIGEALIDFIPDRSGCDFDEVTSFSPKIGGAPANVLGAFAKLGGKTQLLTHLGDDPFGHKILNKLNAFGIGTAHVRLTECANTALAFVSLNSEGDRTFSFYRNPSADMLYDEKYIEDVDFSDCFGLHFCSVSLGDFPMKLAHIAAIEKVKNNNAIISFDPNLRRPLWKSDEAMINAVKEFLPYADIIKVSDEEINLICGTDDIHSACQMLLKDAKLVICTCGANGAYAFTENATVYASSERVKAVDTTGAGDIFHGAFTYAIANKFDMIKTLKIANISGALSVTKIGGQYSIPTLDEVMRKYDECSKPR